jgi:hypothetical protein
MLKFLGLVVLLGGAFVLGYYIGQRSTADLEKIAMDLSRYVLKTTTGFERGLKARQGLADIKAQIIQAKSELFDRNYGNAAKTLGELVGNLELIRETGTRGQTDITALIAKVRSAQQELHSGKMVARTRLDEIQKEVDALATR